MSKIEPPLHSSGESSERVEEKTPSIEPSEGADNVGGQSSHLSGLALSLCVFALCIATLCVALDNTIIATAIPRITDDFRSLKDVGWYRSYPLRVPAAVVEHCMNRFFDRLFPTIPILTRDYVAYLNDTARGPSAAAAEARSLLHAVCALVLLQAEDPGSQIPIGPAPQPPAASGRELLDWATATHTQSVGPARVDPSLEMCLLTFFLYACHAATLHHSQAFYYLRAATALWQLRASHPQSASHPHAPLGNRLFWVLLVSERSHAIRYRRTITMLVCPDTEPPEDTASLAGYSSLAALFQPLGTLFFALLNREEPSVSCPPNFLHGVEASINAAVRSTDLLHDTQKANLRVTQLWLRTVIWQLRLRLGHLQQESERESLTYSYPLVIARELILSTRDLAVGSMAVHGVGLTEKIFDIASAVVDVLARVPVATNGARSRNTEGEPQSNLVYLRNLIKQLPSGQAIYDALLEKQIEATRLEQEI
ncbi:hypothetical protein B0T16DRAFT_457269 [Cercophora newfieldiana]|uniref:Transcription factor domain-containing protein n=1 Tax=Cercophora newfieldiana TaxID=92897 RepID=A0AA39YC36_9PEZI|nr:hypothetical protein B0T16DRAFT_457269 [Cercophora newfieldiana]